MSLDAIATAADEGTDLEEFIKGFTEHVGQWLSVRVQGTAEKLEIADVEKARFEELAPRLPEEDILRILKSLLDLEAELRRSVQPRFRVEMTLVRLSRMGRSMEIGELLRKVQDMAADRPRPAAPASPSAAGTPKPEKRARSQSSPKPAQGSSASGDGPKAADKAALSLEGIRACWVEVMERLKKDHPTTANSLAEARLDKLDGSTLQLLFLPDAGFQKSRVHKNRAAVEKALSAATGQPVRIRCESAEKADAPSGKAGKVPAEDPKLRAVLDAFDGELV